MLGFSSKWFDKRTTGRFGLGFKSVYLVTDNPLIVSRWLAVRITGTLLPEAASEAVELARSFGAERPATVIELPRRQNGPVPSEYAKSFRDSLGPLCVFAKAIRTISWKAWDEELESTWRPSSVLGIAGLEVGRLEPGTDGAAAQRVLVFREGTEALLLHGGKGVVPIADAVPTVWTLAPTSECWRVQLP